MEIPWSLWATCSWFKPPSKGANVHFFFKAASPLQAVCPHPVSLSLPGEPRCWYSLPTSFLYIHPVPPTAQGAAFPFVNFLRLPSVQFFSCHLLQVSYNFCTGTSQQWACRETGMQHERPVFHKKKTRQKNGQDQRANADGWHRDTKSLYMAQQHKVDKISVLPVPGLLPPELLRVTRAFERNLLREKTTLMAFNFSLMPAMVHLV